MAPPLCHGLSHPPLAARVDAVPGAPALFDPGVYLVAAQPGYEAKLFGAIGV